jgi:hypothetical protein
LRADVIHEALPAHEQPGLGLLLPALLFAAPTDRPLYLRKGAGRFATSGLRR